MRKGLVNVSRGIIRLPRPMYDSGVSIERALLGRRSYREYKKEPLTLAEISQLLWAVQGVTDPEGFRTTPSAGALYPLEVYVVAGNVEGLSAGIYKYKPKRHELTRVMDGDKRSELYASALGQDSVKSGAAVIVLSAVYERTVTVYGERGRRYVHMEVGHAAQNACLQAVTNPKLEENVGAVLKLRGGESITVRGEIRGLSLIPIYSIGGHRRQIVNPVLSRCEIVFHSLPI